MWQEYTRELESALERTSQPLSSAVDCLDKHHLRNDYDQLRLDEVEDTLTEVRHQPPLCKCRAVHKLLGLVD